MQRWRYVEPGNASSDFWKVAALRFSGELAEVYSWMPTIWMLLQFGSSASDDNKRLRKQNERLLARLRERQSR